MLCDNFKCVNLVDDECDLYGGACIGNQCEDWGECLNCQKVTEPGDCWKDMLSYAEQGRRQQVDQNPVHPGY